MNPLGDRLTRRRDLYLTSQSTDIHVPARVRTRNPNKRAAADGHLRLLGHWNRQDESYSSYCTRMYQHKSHSNIEGKESDN